MAEADSLVGCVLHKLEEKESGITIHYTKEHYDEGGIICQQKCPVLPGDTPEELANASTGWSMNTIRR